VEAILVFIVWGAGAVAGYFRDLSHGIEQAKGSQEERMAAMERALALADLMVLAVLADGVVSDDEWNSLRALFEGSKLSLDPKETVQRLQWEAAKLSDPRVLKERIYLKSRVLSEKDRAEALWLVKELARTGSGLGGANEGGYRGARKSDPRALVELFAKAMEIDEETRAKVERGNGEWRQG
jgi:uncharacterized tellurite resistance protein B-like protein